MKSCLSLRFIRLFLSFVALSPWTLLAEIEWVTVDWNAGVCDEACVGRIQQHLASLYSVTKVEIDRSGTMAKLTWRPNQPFDYKKIEYAVAWVGVGLRNIGIKVRGTVTHDSSNYYLTSIGDRGRFILLEGAPHPNSGGELYTLGNPLAYPLTSVTRDKLRTTEVNSQVVTIEGYLLMFWRLPLYLIVTKLSVADKNNQPLENPRYSKNPY
jgi:hypothetical protein